MPNYYTYTHVGIVEQRITKETSVVRLRPAKNCWITAKGWKFRKDTGHPPRTLGAYEKKGHRFYTLDLSTIQDVPQITLKKKHDK